MFYVWVKDMGITCIKFHEISVFVLEVIPGPMPRLIQAGRGRWGGGWFHLFSWRETGILRCYLLNGKKCLLHEAFKSGQSQSSWESFFSCKASQTLFYQCKLIPTGSLLLLASFPLEWRLPARLRFVRFRNIHWELDRMGSSKCRTLSQHVAASLF